MKKMLYLVSLKLDEPPPYSCTCLSSCADMSERVEHVSAGWYKVRVIADNEEYAINRAKHQLADYKNVRVDDFFENTVFPEYWSLDTFAVCPECHREYKDWKLEGLALEYYVCPMCRRRCRFEESPDQARAAAFNKLMSDIFD